MARKEPIFTPEELIPPDPVGDVKALSADLPADRDDHSDDGLPATDHDDAGWRAARWWKP